MDKTIYIDKESVLDNEYSLSEIEEVILSSKVKYLGNRAFFHCIKLKNVVFEGDTIEMGYECFSACKSLKSIKSPRMTHVPFRCFFGASLEEITFPDIYSYTPVGGLIPLPKVWMHNTVKVHTWTGSTWKAADKNATDDKNEEMVFVTETGSVYHKSAGCHYLKLSLNQIPGSQAGKARNDYGEKYHPCEICSRNQKPSGSVYVTGTGNRYHNLETCSGLKRTVKLVKQSEVKNMHACSKCG